MGAVRNVLPRLTVRGLLNVPGPFLNHIIGPGTVDTGALLSVSTNNSGQKPLVVRGAAGQTANLAEFQNSAGTVLAGIDAAGRNIFNVVQIGTSAATGAASPLPTAPQEYIIVTLSNGVVRKIPSYNP